MTDEPKCRCGLDEGNNPKCPVHQGDEFRLANILAEAHAAYSRRGWDFHLYRAQARAVLAAGYALRGDALERWPN